MTEFFSAKTSMSSKKGSNALGDCRGYGCVMGTCDAARERETSKELVNLLTQAIESHQVNILLYSYIVYCKELINPAYLPGITSRR